ncbi:MAG: hypothetical protein EPO02_04365, partial [Nitrospirae bacterium]
MVRFAAVVAGVAAAVVLAGAVAGFGAEKVGVGGVPSVGPPSTLRATPPKEVVGKDGAPMVLVPAGEFLMGSTTTTIEEWSKIDDCGPNKQCSLEDEFPQHP